MLIKQEGQQRSAAGECISLIGRLDELENFNNLYDWLIIQVSKQAFAEKQSNFSCQIFGQRGTRLLLFVHLLATNG